MKMIHLLWVVVFALAVSVSGVFAEQPPVTPDGQMPAILTEAGLSDVQLLTDTESSAVTGKLWMRNPTGLGYYLRGGRYNTRWSQFYMQRIMRRNERVCALRARLGIPCPVRVAVPVLELVP